MSTLTEVKKQQITEAALFAAGKPLSTKELLKFFPREENLTIKEVKKILDDLVDSYADKGVVLKEVSSGFRFQVNTEVFSYLDTLYEEKPARYSRALMETLALIAYRQPITRGEIEDVRGVGVSTNIINTLLEHEWVKAVGHREVPGRPALYATTNRFLDYFNLKSLADLPPLAELKDLEIIAKEFEQAQANANNVAEETEVVVEELKVQKHNASNLENSQEDEEQEQEDEQEDAEEDEDASDEDDNEDKNSEEDDAVEHEEGFDEYDYEDEDEDSGENTEASLRASTAKENLKREQFEEIAMVVVDEIVEPKPEKKERKNLINNLKSKQNKQFD